jgi:hypothetical protein
VVGADAHGRAVLLADAHQGGEALADALQLLGVLVRIGVLADVELLLVGVVAGFTRTFSTMRAAISAALGVKWMSATKGVLKPAARIRFLISARFSASFLLGR